MLAQQALEAIAGKLPRQHAFHKFVDILSKEQQDGLGEAPVIQVSHKSHCLSRFLHDSILQQPFSEIPALSGDLVMLVWLGVKMSFLSCSQHICASSGKE